MDDGLRPRWAAPAGRDAATIVPWAVYESYGSDEVLERQLDSMRRWVEHLRRRAGDDVVLPTERSSTATGSTRMPRATARGRRRCRPTTWRTRSTCTAPACSPDAERLVGDAARAAEYDDASPTDVAAATWERWGERGRRARRPGPRSRSSSTSRPRPTACGSPTASPPTCAPSDGRIATGFLGTPLVLYALVALRPPRRGVPDAASPRGAVVALPGRPRRDHRVGALGRDPARRHASTPATWTRTTATACSRSTTTRTAR